MQLLPSNLSLDRECWTSYPFPGSLLLQIVATRGFGFGYTGTTWRF